MSEETTKENKINREDAVHLLAGTERNMVAVVEHYKYLETTVSNYLKKVEEKREIVFDDYIADILVVDLLVNDFATFIGHMKVTSLSAFTKMMKDQMKEEEQDKAFLKLLKIENDLERVKDEEYYEIILDKNIDIIIEKAKEKNLEGVFENKKKEEREDSEDVDNNERQIEGEASDERI